MKESVWNVSNQRHIYLRSEPTILESFLKLCSEMPNEFVCKDEALGFVSYKKMRKAVIALASQLIRYPDPYIGVMMPASAGAYISYFAILLAGKVPVMMNWTQGIRELRACAELTHVRYVLTASHLVQHIKQTHQVQKYPFELLYVENVLRRLSVWSRMRVAAYDLMPRRWLWSLFPCRTQKETDTAVILFTSGTEKKPKAVPLTHANLKANQRACFRFFDPKETDVMMSFLPPFHAYGFNSCSLFPILAGLPLIFAFNPLHPKKLSRKFKRRKPLFLEARHCFSDICCMLLKNKMRFWIV